MMPDLGQANVNPSIEYLKALNRVVFVLTSYPLQLSDLVLEVVKGVMRVNAHHACGKFEIMRSASIGLGQEVIE